MSDAKVVTENKVQEYVVQTCKFLPDFVDKWKQLLEEVKKPLRGLLNLAEQLRHVEKVKKNEDGFTEMQQRVLFSIYEGIEEDLQFVKNIIENLNKFNNSLKNKFSTLENASLGLDWDNKDSVIIKGSALQPPLKKLLNLCFDFLIFFVTAGKNIQTSVKELNVRNEKVMNKLEESFEVDFQNKAVTNLLAFTQYVANEKSLV